MKKIRAKSVYKLLLLLFCAAWFGVSVWLVTSALHNHTMRFDTGRIIVPATIHEQVSPNKDVISEFNKYLDSLVTCWPGFTDSIEQLRKKYLYQFKK